MTSAAAAAVCFLRGPPTDAPRRLEPALLRRALIGGALLFLTCFLFVPLAFVFYSRSRRARVYVAAVFDADALAASD